jgi:hypothetical protein
MGLVRCVREKQWTPLAPAASAIAVLLATMSVSYYAGLRHVLVVFPLLAVVAGSGAARLWQQEGKYCIWGRALRAGLLLWQGISLLAPAPTTSPISTRWQAAIQAGFS